MKRDFWSDTENRVIEDVRLRCNKITEGSSFDEAVNVIEYSYRAISTFLHAIDVFASNQSGDTACAVQWPPGEWREKLARELGGYFGCELLPLDGEKGFSVRVSGVNVSIQALRIVFEVTERWLSVIEQNRGYDKACNVVDGLCMVLSADLALQSEPWRDTWPGAMQRCKAFGIEELGYGDEDYGIRLGVLYALASIEIDKILHCRTLEPIFASLLKIMRMLGEFNEQLRSDESLASRNGIVIRQVVKDFALCESLGLAQVVCDAAQCCLIVRKVKRDEWDEGLLFVGHAADVAIAQGLYVALGRAYGLLGTLRIGRSELKENDTLLGDFLSALTLAVQYEARACKLEVSADVVAFAADAADRLQ